MFFETLKVPNKMNSTECCFEKLIDLQGTEIWSALFRNLLRPLIKAQQKVLGNKVQWYHYGHDSLRGIGRIALDGVVSGQVWLARIWNKGNLPHGSFDPHNPNPKCCTSAEHDLGSKIPNSWSSITLAIAWNDCFTLNSLSIIFVMNFTPMTRSC